METELTPEQMRCGYVLYGPPALCTCGTCPPQPECNHEGMMMQTRVRGADGITTIQTCMACCHQTEPTFTPYD